MMINISSIAILYKFRISEREKVFPDTFLDLKLWGFKLLRISTSLYPSINKNYKNGFSLYSFHDIKPLDRKTFLH